MNILINCRSTGRIASVLHYKLITLGIEHAFINDVFVEDFHILDNGITHLIAMAWNTKPGYKDDPEMNKRYALTNSHWINEAKRLNVHSTYLGTSDNSGFESCLYHESKNSLDGLADVTLKIPYVWQPSREGSIAYLVENNLPYKIFNPGQLVSYVTEDEIVCKILDTIDAKGTFDLASKKAPLSYWINYFNQV